MLRITFISVAINFISIQYCPMLFESVWICFQVTNALLEQVLLLWGVAEVVYDLVVRAYGARDVVRCPAHLLFRSGDKRWGWFTIACNYWAWPLSTITCVIGSFISWCGRCIPLNTLLLESRAEVLLVSGHELTWFARVRHLVNLMSVAKTFAYCEWGVLALCQRWCRKLINAERRIWRVMDFPLFPRFL